jgi:hypothetical protein
MTAPSATTITLPDRSSFMKTSRGILPD